MNEEVEIGAIAQSFLDLHDSEVDIDQVKLGMVQAGAKFSNVTRLYNEFMITYGFAESKAEKDELLTTTLTDVDLSDEDNFNTAVDEVENGLKNTDSKKAASIIRVWCKANDVECYKKAVGQGYQGFRGKVYEFFIESPHASNGEVDVFIGEYGSASDVRSISYYYKLRDAFSKAVNKAIA